MAAIADVLSQRIPAREAYQEAQKVADIQLIQAVAENAKIIEGRIQILTRLQRMRDSRIIFPLISLDSMFQYLDNFVSERSLPRVVVEDFLRQYQRNDEDNSRILIGNLFVVTDEPHVALTLHNNHEQFFPLSPPGALVDMQMHVYEGEPSIIQAALFLSQGRQSDAIHRYYALTTSEQFEVVAMFVAAVGYAVDQELQDLT